MVRSVATLCVALVGNVGIVAAQRSCLPAGDPAAALADWDPPFTRIITVHAGEQTLRDALDRLAESARVRFTYVAEAIPLERRVCLDFDAVPLGAVLANLLAGVNVRAVAANADHVVLTPARVASNAPRAAAAEPAAAVVLMLDPLEVVSEAVALAARSSPVSTTIIEGEQLARRSTLTLAHALNAAAPGLWVWNPSGSSLLAQYASTRGAASFRSGSPKVYVDGIELANPQLLARISPAAIDRIEVIRGPQGAALHGANAIGGVLNVITRHHAPQGRSPLLIVTSGLGLSSTAFAPADPLAQDHAVSLLAGVPGRSMALNVSLGRLGEFAPGGSARHVAADVSGRVVGAAGRLTATLRMLDARGGTAHMPLHVDSAPLAEPRTRLASPQPATNGYVRQYTAGLTAASHTGGRWAHTITAGFDGYRLEGLGEVASFAIGNGAAASGLRGTVRFSNVGHYELADIASARITVAVERSLLHQRIDDGSRTDSPVRTVPSPTVRVTGQGYPLAAPASELSQVLARANTGLSARTDLALRDRLFLAAGLRLERDGGLLERGEWATLPMLGAAWLTGSGATELKLRGAYGKAIRWRDATPVRQAHARFAFEAVAPFATTGFEEQAGVEGGFDLRIGRAFLLEVTRFDQTASGLVQPVATQAHVVSGRGSLADRMVEEMRNVGEVDNRGWELKAAVATGPLSLSGNLSIVDSRVRRVAAGYNGDLRAGDRMLGVPARTASATAAWSGSGWFASLTGSRAMRWIDYDRVALLLDGVAVAPGLAPAEALRDYWREYDGFTHLSASFARELSRGVSLTLTGDNLLGVQSGEPDNLTIVPGRTISVGARVSF